MLSSGVASPPMTDDDESAANKALETLGLPMLPRHDAIVSPLDGAQSRLVNGLDSSTTEAAVREPHANSELAFPSDPALQLDGSMPHQWDDAAFNGELYSTSVDNSTVSPDWPWMALFASDQDLLPMAHASIGADSILAPPQGNGSGDEDEVDQELVGQIAARFGSLHVAPDGKLRYFGTPANVHLFNNTRGPYSNTQSVKVDGAQLLQNAELDADVPSDIEQHLVELYFAWHNSCNPVVNEEMYHTLRKQHHQSTDLGGYYSDVLTNAMYVMAQLASSSALTVV